MAFVVLVTRSMIIYDEAPTCSKTMDEIDSIPLHMQIEASVLKERESQVTSE